MVQNDYLLKLDSKKKKKRKINIPLPTVKLDER